MTDRVKVYEEKGKKGLPLWAWLLPLLLLLGLLAYFLTRHHDTAPATTNNSTGMPAAAPSSGMPQLGTVHFDTDKATITPEGQATLQQAAAYMKQTPGAHLRVEGFTDSTGTDPHNLTLSQQRANAVGEYLKGQGVEGSRLTGEGFGEAKPTDTNATEAGKADNRRVELFTK